MNFYILNTDESTPVYIRDIELAASDGEIDVGRIHLCSKDKKDYGDSVVVHREGGADFLANYLAGISPSDLDTDDQLIPSHNAPHVLAQAAIRLLEKRGCYPRTVDFSSEVGTPYELDLERGLKAVSFATGECPADCIEPEICPVKNVRLDWDVGETLEEYSGQHEGAGFVGFECAHFVRSVSTIPMKRIIHGWLRIEKAVFLSKGSRFLIATHSKCHGIAALVEV